MTEINLHHTPDKFNSTTVIIFRFVFIFLLLLTIPLDPAYYARILSINIFHIHFQDLFQLTNYVPRLVHISSWGIASYAGWGIAAVIALAGTAVWPLIEKKQSDKSYQTDYNQLYYWLRVIIRYRLALALIGYGVIKLIPVQIPAPTLSDLNTAYGSFLPWKIYYLSTGVASAYYEPTLGAIEIFAGLLLLSSRTTVIGASIAASLLINIVLVNYAYQLGEHVYSVYLLILSVFLLAYDTPRLYQLLVARTTAKGDHFKPVFKHQYIQNIRRPVKILVLLFTITYAFITYQDYTKSRWPFPDQTGITYGLYNVKEFSINNVTLPYSPTDTTRWQDVVFEKWNVLSIGASRQFPINLHGPKPEYQKDFARNYESQGNGGRAFYSYTVKDSTIRLYNKNVPEDKLTFKISRPNQLTIILKGVTASKDSLRIVLNKLDKQYLLHKGRRKPVTIL